MITLWVLLPQATIICAVKNPDIHQLIEQLSSTDWQVSRQASQQLMKIGPEVIPALIDALQGADINTTVAIISVFEVVNDSRAIDPMIDLLLTNQPELAQPLVFALGRLGETVVDPLAQILGNQQQPIEVRIQAASTLARTDSAIAIDPLFDALYDAEPRLQQTAANSLGWIRRAEVLQAVDSALRHENEDVRYEVTQGLEWRAYYLEGIPEGSYIEAWVNEVAVPMLLLALTDSNVDVRASAAAGLGWVYNDQAVTALVNHLDDESNLVRHNAAASLGEIAQPDTVPALIRALEAGNEEAAVALDVIVTLHGDSEYASSAQAALDAYGSLSE